MRAGGTRTTLAVVIAMVMAMAPASADERGTAPPLVADDAIDTIDELVAGPAAHGDVLVEIELAVPWAAEPGLSGASRRSQRADISRAQAQLRRHLRGTDHQIVHEYEGIPFLAGHLSADALERLRDSDVVASVRQSLRAVPMLADSTAIVRADVANHTGWTGQGATVAVIDTGVETGHEFFGGRVVAEACFSSDGDCQSGGTEEIGPGTGAACDFDTGCFHGTHVAGIAAGDDDADRTGVAPDASIIAINAASGNPGPLGFYDADIVAALDHVHSLGGTHDIAAVNLSLGHGQFSGVCDGVSTAYNAAVANLAAAGIAVVAASGNDDSPNAMAWPACQSDTVSVGNTCKDDTVYDEPGVGSNSSGHLDLLAPGADITSADVGGGYREATGTSMAAPHVAGAFAVLADAMGTAGTEADLDTRLALLADHGLPVTDPRQGRVRPRIDVAASLYAHTGERALLGDGPIEPDVDAWEAAASLASGDPVDGLLCADGEEDWYSIDAGAGDTVTATLDYDGDAAGLSLHLYGPEARKLLDSSAAGHGHESVSDTTRHDGAHLLRVRATTTAPAVPYELTATVERPEPDPPAPTPAPTPDPPAPTPATTPDASGVEPDATSRDPAPAPETEELAVDRLAGGDRIETAARISADTFASAPTAVLARADTYPDALAGAPLAAKLAAPILLTGSSGLSDRARAEVTRLDAGRVVLLGGEAALSGQVHDDLVAMGVEVDRIAGVDRFDTARKIAAAVGGTHAYVTEGTNADPSRGWPDAVAVSALAAHEQRPILLVSRDEMPVATARAVVDLGIARATVVGGEGAVSGAVQTAVSDLGVTVDRVAGGDRFDTSRRLAARAEAAGMAPARPWLATGLNYPDALVAGPAVAADGGILLFVHGETLDGSVATQEWIHSHASTFTRVVVVGGVNVVADRVIEEVEDASATASRP